jgi:hypothetical protein
MPNKKASADDQILNPNSGLDVRTSDTSTAPGIPGQQVDYTNPAGKEQDLSLTDITIQDKEALTQEIGRSGVLIMNGFIIAEEYNPDLIGREGIKKYDQMRRGDASCKAALNAIKLPIIASDWHIDVPEGDPEALGNEKKEFIEQQLFSNMKFETKLREALTCVDFGFSIFEKTFKLGEKGRVEIDKWGFRKQYSIYRWQMGDGQPGIQQYLLSGGFRDIPEYKVTLFSPEKEGDNYAGMSVLRAAYRDWYYKDLLTKINAMSHERHGIGIPLITMEGNASPEEMKNLEEAARNMRAGQQAFIRLTDNIRFEILDMKSQTREQILPSIEFHNKQIYQSILAQFLQLSQSASGGGSGSRALSEDMSKLFMRSLEYLADYIASVFNEDLIKDLIELNWGKGAACPKLAHEKIGDDNLQLMGDFVQSLAQSRLITPTVETEQAVRAMAGLPQLSEEEVATYVAPEQPQTGLTASARALDDKITKIIEA